MKQSRVKSPVLWGAVAGIILLVLQHFGLEGEAQAGGRLADVIFQLVCAILAVFGVANNPTDKEKF